MSNLLRSPVELRLNRARILWLHWQHEHAAEGYVREFSPDGSHVRISRTPRDSDKGHWHRAGDLRCAQVLETNFDFKTWNLREKERRKRASESDISGDEWKYDDDDDEPEGSSA